MATYGYGRVSRMQQCTENQKLVLELQQKIKIDQWFEEHGVSGKVKAHKRPMFAKMLALAQKGDTVVFTRVDRISRRASDTLNTVEGLLERGVEVFILQLGDVPLSSQAGKMMMGIYAIFAEGERDFIVERTNEGLSRTKKQGTVLGPPLLIDPFTLRAMCQDREEGMSLDTLAKRYNFPRQTIYRNTKKYANKLDAYEAEFLKREQQYAKEL
jgi:putative DNA-invertase from lambdoid prophage Rac